MRGLAIASPFVFQNYCWLIRDVSQSDPNTGAHLIKALSRYCWLSYQIRIEISNGVKSFP